eukprot:g2632.t1
MSGQNAWAFSREEFVVKQLEEGRSKRKESRKEASEADMSDPRFMGFWNSTVARVKMSEYLCALAYKEAIQLFRGEVESSHVMSESQRTAEVLRRVVET